MVTEYQATWYHPNILLEITLQPITQTIKGQQIVLSQKLILEGCHLQSAISWTLLHWSPPSGLGNPVKVPPTLQVPYLVHLSPTWIEGYQSRPRQRPCSPTDFYFTESYLQHHTRFLGKSNRRKDFIGITGIYFCTRKTSVFLLIDNKCNKKHKTSKVKIEVAIKKTPSGLTIVTTQLRACPFTSEWRGKGGCVCVHVHISVYEGGNGNLTPFCCCFTAALKEKFPILTSKSTVLKTPACHNAYTKPQRLAHWYWKHNIYIMQINTVSSEI